jgi:hypothetical protein
LSITYQVEPVIEAVRAFLDRQLTTVVGEEQSLPLMSALTQYQFDPSLCPVLVMDPVSSIADWNRYASGDVQFTLHLNLHEIRLRSGESNGEEMVAVQLLSTLASTFSNNYRLNGNVQNILVDSIGPAEPDVLHKLGIPMDEHSIFAMATMRTRVIWIENSLVAV